MERIAGLNTGSEISGQRETAHQKGGRMRWLRNSMLAVGSLLLAACEVSAPVEVPRVEDSQADTNRSYPELLTLSNFNPGLGFTAEAWIKPSKPVFTGYIVSKMGSTQNGFSLFAHSFPSEQNPKEFVVNYEFGVVNRGNDCAYHRITQQRRLPELEVISWQHVAGEIHPNGQLDIFVNGERSTTNWNSVTGVCPRDLPINIGARQLTDGADGIFDGLIDLRLSDTARYLDNFSISRSPFLRDSNTVALYIVNGS